MEPRIYAIAELKTGYPRNTVDGRKYLVADVHFSKRAAAERAAKSIEIYGVSRVRNSNARGYFRV